MGLFNSTAKLSFKGMETDRALMQKDGFGSKIWDGVTQSSMPLSQEL